MPGSPRAQPTKGPEVVEGDVVSGQVQRGVQRGGGMHDREHHSVSVEPGGVVPKPAGVEPVGERCERHARSRVTRAGVLYGDGGQQRMAFTALPRHP